MRDAAAKIEALIAGDDLAGALDALRQLPAGTDNETRNELVALQARLSTLEKKSRRAVISAEDEQRFRNEIRYAALDLLADVQSAGRRPLVFISYCHGDRAVAMRLRTALENENLAVRIDVDAIAAGQDLHAFISQAVRESDATVSIVSNQSLLSPWVAMETITTFFHERLNEKNRFIACYIDDDFFDRAYRLKVTMQIDAKLADLDKLISEHAAAKLDTQDLNHEKSRLFDLRNNLGVILQRLRESLCLDIRNSHFNESIVKLAAVVLN